MIRSAWLLGLYVLLAACGGNKGVRTQVMVVIDAQSETRARAADVDFEVRTGTGKVTSWALRLRQNITPGSKLSWPLEVALVPRGGDANRVFLAIATARDKQGKAVAQVRAISGYQRGKTLSLLLLFENACVDKVDLCDPEQTCRRGECVDAHVTAKTLPPYERNDAGQPVPVPFWSDAGADAEVDSGKDASDSVNMDAGADAAMPTLDCTGDSDCDDEDPCNGAEHCEASVCKKGKAFECPAIEQPCLANVCVVVKGKAQCEARDADEGKACQAGDESSAAEVSCSRDYECVSGTCEPQTIEDCNPTQCEKRAGCAADIGCLFDPKPSTTDCDDGEACTQTDKCTGTDGTCAGVAYSCDDTVACTVDVCDGAGGCTNTASDDLCGGPCKAGTCDATSGCLNVTFSQDFIDCDDGKAGTGNDVCYHGECVGEKKKAPAGSCEVAGCGCAGFGAVRDLDYYAGASTAAPPIPAEYYGLIDATQSGASPCTSSTVSIVYTVTPDALTPYTTDTDNGAISDSGSDLSGGYVVSNTHVGFAYNATHEVDWVGNAIGDLVAGKTISSLRGMTRYSSGSIATSSESDFWVWGSDTAASGSSRVVRCWSCSSITMGGCSHALSCDDVAGYPASSIAGIAPYLYGKFSAYGGALQLVNLSSSGTPKKRIYEDGTSKDYFVTDIESADNDGAWSGALRTSATGQVLVYGSGSNNLTLCTDASNTGDTVCVPITGLPNQSLRSYTRAVMGYGNTAILMLASSGGSYYLVALPSGLDPTVGSNWREILLANSGTTANALSAGPSSFMVIGKAGAVPYVWSWQP